MPGGAAACVEDAKKKTQSGWNFQNTCKKVDETWFESGLVRARGGGYHSNPSGGVGGGNNGGHGASCKNRG